MPIDMTHICADCGTDTREGTHSLVSVNDDGDGLTVSCRFPRESSLPRLVCYIDPPAGGTEYWYRRSVPSGAIKPLTQQTIRIKRAGCYDDIPADVDGPFAIHETIPLSLGGWTLTHIPSGYAVLTSVLHGRALACRAELLASGLDWTSVAAPADLTPAHRRVGRAMEKKYGEQR